MVHVCSVSNFACIARISCCRAATTNLTAASSSDVEANVEAEAEVEVGVEAFSVAGATVAFAASAVALSVVVAAVASCMVPVMVFALVGEFPVVACFVAVVPVIVVGTAFGVL